MLENTAENIKSAAPQILTLIQSAQAILLHCHIFPDGDSVGSSLAMKLALEQLGKKVTLIRGDSQIPEVFMTLPGAHEIVEKNFFEIDLSQFDLFIIQDSAALDRISQVKEIVFPQGMKTVIIDHHVSNTRFAKDVNLVESAYPSTTLILLDIFKEWGIELTHDISMNLFMGAYTDTGGFKYESTTPDTFLAAAELVKNAPDYWKYIFNMDNSHSQFELFFQGAALSTIEVFLEGHLAISAVSYEVLKKLAIPEVNINGGMLANILKSVVGWDIGVCLTELNPGTIKVSFRTRDSQKYDLSRIARLLGGGGHKAAAGIVLKDIPLDEAKQKIVDSVRQYTMAGVDQINNN